MKKIILAFLVISIILSACITNKSYKLLEDLPGNTKFYEEAERIVISVTREWQKYPTVRCGDSYYDYDRFVDEMLIGSDSTIIGEFVLKPTEREKYSGPCLSETYYIGETSSSGYIFVLKENAELQIADQKANKIMKEFERKISELIEPFIERYNSDLEIIEQQKGTFVISGFTERILGYDNTITMFTENYKAAVIFQSTEFISIIDDLSKLSINEAINYSLALTRSSKAYCESLGDIEYKTSAGFIRLIPTFNANFIVAKAIPYSGLFRVFYG